jgi:hypothetical protein
MVVSKGRSAAHGWVISCLAALIAIAASSAFAVNFDQPVTFNIPAGALSKALIEFSKQSHVQVLSSGARTKAAMTDGLSGTFTIGEALTRLVKSSGLKFKLLDTDAVAIESGNSDGARRIDPPAAKAAGQAALLASPGDGAPAAMPSGELDAGKKPKSSPRDESLEEIVITGSHLALPDKQGAVPVQVYTREDIKNSGRTTIAEFMNTLPDVSISLHESDFQTYVGQATVRLHGLPIGTTLLLLKGRRVESSF